MSRLIVVRVGNPDNLWVSSITAGKWSSPECHLQMARSAFVEGYRVNLLFLATGDIPLVMARLTNVRARYPNETVLPVANELGNLSTIIEFTDVISMPRCDAILSIIRYMVGSQVQVIGQEASDLMAQYSRSLATRVVNPGNRTFINPAYFMNYN